MEILCFFAGVAFFYLRNFYPLSFLGIVLFFRPKLKFCFWFLAAISWAAIHQWLVTPQGLPSTNMMSDASLEGYISSIPNQTLNKIQFQFLVHSLNQKPIQLNLLLSCYNQCPHLAPGEHWRLRAKIKKAINFANPGSFDYASWLNSRHIFWIGTTYRNTFEKIASSEKHYPLIKFRNYLDKTLYELNSNEQTLGVIEALTIGLTHHITKEQWDLFRRTGTTHLIDISGEHIVLIAGLSYGLLKWSFKRLGKLCLYYPAPKFASLGAIIVSFIYALIAGFAVPTQRAFITSILMLGRYLMSQRISIWQSWRYALLVVLLFEPHSIYMLGFYFSFLAVAILILINDRMKAKGAYKVLGMQLACMFGLMPLSLYWFSYGSINGLIANLLAIPWVSFMIVPLALTVTFLCPWVVIPGSMALLKWSINTLLAGLTLIDSFDYFNFTFTFTSALEPLALMLAMSIFIFLPVKKFWFPAGILLLASFFPKFEKITPGEVVIDTLDVGQGLAIAIRTAHHTLLYDTGMKFYQSSDMGKLVIIPYLNTLGIKKLDTVIISHPDLDHRGGLISLEKNYKINALIVDNPLFYNRGVSCHTYPEWHWDGVAFRFFPIKRHLSGKNNNSCILQIKNAAGSVLLSGDIEKLAENYLLTTYGKALQSDAMLIPHHGSKTSSSMAYVKQVSPQYAFVAYGFDNRYKFPHPQAMQAYSVLNIPVYNTLECGMIRISLQKGGLTPKCYRKKPTPLFFRGY
jgi:competence protein ComEC